MNEEQINQILLPFINDILFQTEWQPQIITGFYLFSIISKNLNNEFINEIFNKFENNLVSLSINSSIFFLLSLKNIYNNLNDENKEKSLNFIFDTIQLLDTPFLINLSNNLNDLPFKKKILINIFNELINLNLYFINIILIKNIFKFQFLDFINKLNYLNDFSNNFHPEVRLGVAFILRELNNLYEFKDLIFNLIKNLINDKIIPIKYKIIESLSFIFHLFNEDSKLIQLLFEQLNDNNINIKNISFEILQKLNKFDQNNFKNYLLLINWRIKKNILKNFINSFDFDLFYLLLTDDVFEVRNEAISIINQIKNINNFKNQFISIIENGIKDQNYQLRQTFITLTIKLNLINEIPNFIFLILNDKVSNVKLTYLKSINNIPLNIYNQFLFDEDPIIQETLSNVKVI